MMNERVIVIYVRMHVCNMSLLRTSLASAHCVACHANYSVCVGCLNELDWAVTPVTPTYGSVRFGCSYTFKCCVSPMALGCICIE